MKKKKLSLPLILGACLVLCSLCFLAVLQVRMYRCTQKSEAVASQMLTLLPEKTPGSATEYPDVQMPVLEIDGTDYVGLLEVPAFGVRLPVADTWEGNRLTPAVGRLWGSAYDRTLIIGGPDYPGQFDFCDDIDIGELITVTDMTGAQFSYSVSRVDRAKHADMAWFTDTACGLTLFCRDMYSLEYVAVRGVLIYH